MFTPDELAWLQRRLIPSVIDAGFYGACCAGILSADDSILRMPAATLMIAGALLEAFSGLSPGKLLCGWRVRMPDHARPAIWRLMIRAVARLSPIGVALLSLLVDDRLLRWQIVAGAAMLGLCFLAATYITIVRWRQTAVDRLAGTMTMPVEAALQHEPS